jgi:VTC domain
MLDQRAIERPDSSPDALEHEVKFTAAATRTPILLAWLAGACVPEQPAPHGIVSSIYYDTDDLDLLDEKADSDYLKTKVRLRWYSDPAGRDAPGRGFLEMKRRVGGRRDKVRLRTEYEGAWLAGVSLDDPRLASLPLRLRGAGVLLPRLVPVLTVRYERHRFVEPSSGVRVSLDTAIGPAAVSRRVSRRPPAGLLSVSVVEVKGHVAALPPTLHALERLGVRRGSFSKYWACYQHVTRRLH